MLGLVNVLLVGAGEINFGWSGLAVCDNNSGKLIVNMVDRRFKDLWKAHGITILGTRLRVVALIDPDQQRAQGALTYKQQSDVGSSWSTCKVYPTIAEAERSLSSTDIPHMTIVGAPPFARGTDVPGQDLELQLVSAFPACALFVEKPVSSGPEAACWRVAEVLAKKQTLVGVGYMLRYLKAVKIIKNVIRNNNLIVMGTNARYMMAYEYARKPAWWDKTRSGGPIVEQATHFCDLSRYFGGDVVLSSVTAHTVQHDEAPGKLSAKRFDEAPIPAENRLPRLTSASWKYKGGAVGTLTHVIALHGTTYDTEFEVYTDGYHFKLVDPYSTPKLYIRQPGLSDVVTHVISDDDPFHAELATFVDVVDGTRERSDILSSYEDAIRTYELTWAIRRASEQSAQAYVR